MHVEDVGYRKIRKAEALWRHYERTQFGWKLMVQRERPNRRGARFHNRRQHRRIWTANYRVHRWNGEGSTRRGSQHGHREGNQPGNRTLPIGAGNGYGSTASITFPWVGTPVEAVGERL